MPGVHHVCGKAHIDPAVFHLPQGLRHPGEILGIVNFRAQQGPHIRRQDPAAVRDVVQRVFGVAGGFPPGHIALDALQPQVRLLRIQVIEGLGGQGAVEAVNVHRLNPPVRDDGLEVLLRQGHGGGNGHAAFRAA